MYYFATSTEEKRSTMSSNFQCNSSIFHFRSVNMMKFSNAGKYWMSVILQFWLQIHSRKLVQIKAFKSKYGLSLYTLSEIFSMYFTTLDTMFGTLSHESYRYYSGLYYISAPNVSTTRSWNNPKYFNWDHKRRK